MFDWVAPMFIKIVRRIVLALAFLAVVLASFAFLSLLGG
jgi:hypothetical protein